VCLTLYSQTNDSIKQKNDELKELHNSILELEKDLSEIKQQAKLSRNILQKYDRENLLLNKAINNLKYQERIKSNTIKGVNDSIKKLDQRLNKLQTDYAKYIRWLYMYGKKSEYNIVFSSSSLNQALMRYKYFDYVSDRSEKSNVELKETKEEQLRMKLKLEAEIDYQKYLINEKESQRKKLAGSKQEKEKYLFELSKDEKNYANEIDEKRKAEIVIINLIVRLEEAERERERLKREERLKGNETLPVRDFNYESFADFNELRGKMNWPVKSGKVIRSFGENKNEKLKTVTLNYGIDIQTSADEQVRCVAEGVVSAIEWIPGYGSVVIATHKGKYRTVYGHLSDIEVNENQKIYAGDIIGKVNRTLEGSIIHFEVWSERNYQDPETWLVRK
jgi:septal ring factor EnvC (AmiA/AmiB activator)